MALWDKYAEAVSRFEPSQRWEESVLVLAMIQGMRFKNQLFNHHWAEGRQPGQPATPAPSAATNVPGMPDTAATPETPATPKAAHRCKVLAFRPKDAGES